jgi:hypothetical protein
MNERPLNSEVASAFAHLRDLMAKLGKETDPLKAMRANCKAIEDYGSLHSPRLQNQGHRECRRIPVLAAGIEAEWLVPPEERPHGHVVYLYGGRTSAIGSWMSGITSADKFHIGADE